MVRSMSPQKILIIEDERQISRFLELELTHEGYQVEAAYDGFDGLKCADANRPDLILLDIMLPGLNGLEVCKRIRQFTNIPVIMLTARDETSDKILGLDLGATDYITKPFIIEELLARIRAALRRVRNDIPNENILSAGGLVMDLEGRTVKRDGQAIDLTKHEFDLLAYLMINTGIVLTRDQILSNVWNYDFAGGAKIVDVYIRYLRNKMGDMNGSRLIHTVRGVGYMLKEHRDEE